MYKNICVLSANIGGIDKAKPNIVEQTVPFDHFHYTDANLPFPLPNLDNRMKGKYLKTQMHKFLDYSFFVWIDGCVDITDREFLEKATSHLFAHDVVVAKHNERSNVYEEIDYIMAEMMSGNKYLLKRYKDQPWRKEYDFYRRSRLPESAPLCQCWFFAFRNTEKMERVMDYWWQLILEYTNFDQTQFTYVMWHHRVDVMYIDTSRTLVHKPHRKTLVGRIKELFKPRPVGDPGNEVFNEEWVRKYGYID